MWYMLRATGAIAMNDGLDRLSGRNGRRPFLPLAKAISSRKSIWDKKHQLYRIEIRRIRTNKGASAVLQKSQFDWYVMEKHKEKYKMHVWIWRGWISQCDIQQLLIHRLQQWQSCHDWSIIFRYRGCILYMNSTAITGVHLSQNGKKFLANNICKHRAFGYRHYILW